MPAGQYTGPDSPDTWATSYVDEPVDHPAQDLRIAQFAYPGLDIPLRPCTSYTQGLRHLGSSLRGHLIRDH